MYSTVISITVMVIMTMNTVDGERFTGLNIRGFSAIKVFTEILSCCLGHKCSLFSTTKVRCLYSWKNVRGILLETVKNVKV